MSPEAERSELVTELTNLNVICHTGDATEDREYRLYKTLEPGFYTILFGTFGAEMEGPFNFSVVANYDCKVAQLFPHPWKDGEGPPLTMKERLLQQAQRGLEAAAKLGEQQLQKMQEEAMKQVEENTDWVDKDAEKEAEIVAERLVRGYYTVVSLFSISRYLPSAPTSRREEEEAEKKLEELRAKCPWLKQTDKGTGQVYYYVRCCLGRAREECCDGLALLPQSCAGKSTATGVRACRRRVPWLRSVLLCSALLFALLSSPLSPSLSLSLSLSLSPPPSRLLHILPHPIQLDPVPSERTSTRACPSGKSRTTTSKADGQRGRRPRENPRRRQTRRHAKQQKGSCSRNRTATTRTTRWQR